MNKKGTLALEAVIASGLALMVLTVLTSLFLIFWQAWHSTAQANRQRQWAVMAFEYLDRDLHAAEHVSLTDAEILVQLSETSYSYRVSAENSFYRGSGSIYYPLALVDSASWWWEGELLWIELKYAEESYRCCYYVSEERQ